MALAVQNPALDPSRPVPVLTRRKIGELTEAHTKHLDMEFVVVEKGPPSSTSNGQLVYPVRVADDTGSILLLAFDERGQALWPGDICALQMGYTDSKDGCLRLYVGRLGQLLRRGRFKKAFSMMPDMSTPKERTA